MKRLIQVDFNNRDEAGRVRLNLPCSQRDLERLGEPAQPGLVVWLTDGEGFVRASLESDRFWRAVPDWDTWEDAAWVDEPVEAQAQVVPRRAA
jgi:hypothetical protein